MKDTNSFWFQKNFSKVFFFSRSVNFNFISFFQFFWCSLNSTSHIDFFYCSSSLGIVKLLKKWVFRSFDLRQILFFSNLTCYISVYYFEIFFNSTNAGPQPVMQKEDGKTTQIKLEVPKKSIFNVNWAIFPINIYLFLC